MAGELESARDDLKAAQSDRDDLLQEIDALEEKARPAAVFNVLRLFWPFLWLALSLAPAAFRGVLGGGSCVRAAPGLRFRRAGVETGGRCPRG